MHSWLITSFFPLFPLCFEKPFLSCSLKELLSNANWDSAQFTKSLIKTIRSSNFHYWTCYLTSNNSVPAFNWLPASTREEASFAWICTFISTFLSIQFSGSVSCPTLLDPMNRNTPGPRPSPTPGVHPNSCPLHQWCHPTICCPLLLLPSIFSSIRVLSNESA